MYWKVWELLPEASKEEARTAMHAAALETRVKGAKESKVVVTDRATEMRLGDDGLMTYRLGAHVFPYTFSIDTYHVIGRHIVTPESTQRQVHLPLTVPAR